MISYDQGPTWEDETHYMYSGAGNVGYSQSVVLEDDLIQTIAGSSDYLPARTSYFENVGHSDLTAIRWQPVRK